MVVHGRAAAGAGLRCTVSLEDDDAHVLPRPLERGRQERAGRGEQPQAATELGVDAAEQEPAGRVGELAGHDAQAVERAVRPCFPTSRSTALQNSSSSWGTRSIVVTRCSRSESKITRGFRLRTYRMSAPTSIA